MYICFKIKKKRIIFKENKLFGYLDGVLVFEYLVLFMWS